MRPLTIYPHAPVRFGVQDIPLTGNRTLVWENPTGTQIEIEANNLSFAPTADRTVTLPNGVASADETTSTDGTVLRLGVENGNAYAVTFVSVAGAVIGRVTDGVYLDVRWDASGAPTALASGSDPASTTVSFPGFAGRYLLLNDSYSSDTALAAGIVMNVDPTTTQTTTAGYGVFTPGVVSVSNPSLTVASISGFSAGDLVLISGSTSNDGLYELQAASGQTLAFRSTLYGLSSQVEDFTKNQFVSATEASASVKVTKVSVTVLRAGSDGIMEVGSGSATGITFSDLVRVSDISSFDQEVRATCALADASGGATTALLSVQLYRRDGTTAIASARQVLLLLSSTQYADAAGPSNASLSLGTVTAGSIKATVIAGQLYLIETDATGLFGCTATNTDDETVYVSVKTAIGGLETPSKCCNVVGSNSDAGTWSA